MVLDWKTTVILGAGLLGLACDHGHAGDHAPVDRTLIGLVESLTRRVAALERRMRGEEARPDEEADREELLERLEAVETSLAGLRSSAADLPVTAPPRTAGTEAGRPEPGPDADPAGSGTPDLPARVAKLEEFREEREAAARKESRKATTMKTFGRIHLDHWNFPDGSAGIDAFEHPATGVDPEDRFEFRRLRIGASGAIREAMLYKLELEFADPNDATFKDAYFGFEDLPVLHTVLLGNQKRPLGFDHLNSSRYAPFLERPLPVEAFNEDARRFGVASYGHADEGGLNWRFGVYRLENASGDGSVVGDSRQLSVNGRIAGTPLWRKDGRQFLHLALAGMHGEPDGSRNPTDTNANDARFRTRAELRSGARWLDTGRIAGAESFDTAAAELMLDLGPFALTAETFQNWLDRLQDPQDLHFFGSYVAATWFLTGEHYAFDRTEGTLGRIKPRRDFEVRRDGSGDLAVSPGAFQLALRYSHLDLGDRDIAGGTGNEVTLGFNWYWNPHARMQFNYLIGRIHDHAPARTFTAGDFTAWGTRMMVDF